MWQLYIYHCLFCVCCICNTDLQSVSMWLAAYEQQWLTLAEEYHDHLKDMTSIPGLAGPRQAARTDVNGDSDTWRVQIFRCATVCCVVSADPTSKRHSSCHCHVLGTCFGEGLGFKMMSASLPIGSDCCCWVCMSTQSLSLTSLELHHLFLHKRT